MRTMLLPLAMVFLATRAMGAAEPFYIAVDADKSATPGIYYTTLDSDSGKIRPPVLAAKAPHPGFLAVMPSGKFLVATLANSIGSYEVEPGGQLTALNEQPSGGEGPCHVSFDRGGRAAFVANYGGGNIAAFDVAANGVIGNRFALFPFTGSGPDPARQKKPFAHSIYADPQDKFVYACDLGSDSVWVFRFDALLSKLTPANPPAAKVPPGSGPRHLAFGADGKFVYVLNEMGLSVTTFARDPATGTLTARDTISALLPGTATGHDTAAEILLHPNGRYLYSTVRGCDVLAVFAITADGSIQLIQNTPSVVKFPRSFAIDPGGRWLVAAGQSDGRLAVFAIDPGTGLLSRMSGISIGGSPMCVVFANHP